jgi:transposase-like protein
MSYRSAGEVAGVIFEQQQSGRSVAAFCQERGLRAWQFYKWKKRLREADAPSL